MRSKSIHIGGSEQHTPESHLTWSKHILVILVTLVLLVIIYGLWHVLRTEGPLQIPETTLPVPAP